MKQGAVYENPVTGERMEVLERTEERLLIDFLIAPGGAVPLEHIHPGSSEGFRVLRGRLMLSIDGRVSTAGPGDHHVVPSGVSHAWWNSGETEAHLELEVRPPGRFGAVISTMFQLARDGETDAAGKPSLLQLALMANELRDTARPSSPPLPVQRVIFGVLAPIARLRGLRPLRDYRHDTPAEHARVVPALDRMVGVA